MSLIKAGIYNEKTMASIENFLNNMFQGIEEEAYSVDIQPDGTFAVSLSEFAKDFLLNFDHDCKISGEGGCSYCYYLYELNLIPDADGYESDDQ